MRRVFMRSLLVDGGDAERSGRIWPFREVNRG